MSELPTVIADTCPAASYVVISDSNVAPLHAEQIVDGIRDVAPTQLITFPAGEAHKTRKTWSTITDQMVECGVGRDGAVIAVGGGVVGDIAGFVAATYMRGIPLIQVPTTLLAMIDSSIGGKTGVDTRAGKNLVGAFHQPKLVLADITALETLPTKEFTAGIAEAVKHGAIADAEYLTWLADQHREIIGHDSEAVSALVAGSIAIKATVVMNDEREQGRRAVLNFGHTVGHAVEAASRYALLHGEGVAIGMAIEVQLGANLGVTDADTQPHLRATLERFGLPLTLPHDVPVKKILGFMRHDKKARDRRLRFPLLKRLGEIARPEDGGWTHPVSQAEIDRTLHQSL